MNNLTHRERFARVFAREPVDRIPVYFFGAWPETKRRWLAEGFTGEVDLSADRGPQLPGMDPDWEAGLWNIHGFTRTGAIGDVEPEVLEERENARVVRTSLGKVELIRTDGGSISHTISYPLKPTRESWNRFKRYLDPSDPRRRVADMQRLAQERNVQDILTGFMGGSFYGWIRDYMGVEELSFLMYDDPVLLEEMVDTIADHFMRLMEPVLKVARFEFVYFFEDCCGSSGPLFSPAVYRAIFDKYYKRLIEFYKQRGVPLTLIDSDGMVDPLVPCWLGSGFDIIFPVEVGIWNAGPVAFREKFGKELCMLGGVNKNLFYGSEDALRAHLQGLRPAVEAGGYIPIPDHRIPPQVSYEHMLRYIRLFHEVFNVSQV